MKDFKSFSFGDTAGRQRKEDCRQVCQTSGPVLPRHMHAAPGYYTLGS
jgi:hypothetical protein